MALIQEWVLIREGHLIEVLRYSVIEYSILYFSMLYKNTENSLENENKLVRMVVTTITTFMLIYENT